MFVPAGSLPDRDERPVIAAYCATFLKPEMLHIYRQITALRRVRPVVIARKRESADRFPFDELTLVPRPATQFLRRIWYRQLRGVPWTIGRAETRAIAEVLERTHARLLHIYFGHIAVHLLPLIEHWPRPTVVSFHGADVMVDLEKPAYRAGTIVMLEEVRLVLVRSASLRDALVQLGCPAAKIRIQRTGIPLGELPFRSRSFPPENGAWQFLQACRLIEKKGLATSLRAFAKFAEQYPNARFTIAGDGPLLNEMKEQARELGIAGRVTFAGFISQPSLRELCYRSHIFLHPSETAADGNQEGVPNSMLEAMATGVPAFATNHGGIPEVIEHGVSGVLVAERDAGGLAEELLHYAAHPEKLAAIAEAGAEQVGAKFEQTAQVAQLEDFYFEALRRGASAV
jgi:colanic acid/amylovoran biosynthesis glycosyltransferase